MKVLFVKELPEVAKTGDIKDVAPGFARNYLFPRKFAVVANDKMADTIRERAEAARRRAEKALNDARQLGERMRRLTLTIYARTGEGGRLFGSVTNADVAQQLKREAGIDIDRRRIEIDPPIRSLGPHEVTVQLHPEVVEHLRVVVAAQ
ncbi:MAG TPA: 50S ribosomal protein L9 [Candidatus Sulfotelmatobacter sp.]|nr:50S ribosomal protein L9 [Candidatus Sulfotelmatobacter sp.]